MTLDENIFLLINSHHTDFLDIFMWLASKAWVWIPFYVSIGTWLLYKYGWEKALLFIAMAGMAVGMADYICASVIRPWFQVMRPCNLDNPFSQYVTVVNGYRGGAYGFPSCHAANTFALTGFVISFTKSHKVRMTIFAWAIFVCLTRMYLGVHYPSDLLAGAVIGFSIGLGMSVAAYNIQKRIAYLRSRRIKNSMHLHYHAKIQSNNFTIDWTLLPSAIPVSILILSLMAFAAASMF